MSKIGFSFYELSTVDSTNNYAMAKVHEGMALHGMAVFAHEQTAGKGQRGKTWLTEPGSNIILSVVVETLPIRHLPPFALSKAVALAGHTLFSRYALDETSIKWPNDIYWRDRKAGGILIENAYRGKEWQWSVIGMGINVNQTQFPPTARTPVSLRQVTGRSFNAAELAGELCGYLETEWQALVSGDITGQDARYHQHLFSSGKPVTLRHGADIIQTRIEGVAGDGQLITSGDMRFQVGEVEWMFDH